MLNGRPANSFASIHTPIVAVDDPPSPEDCIPSRRFFKTNITPLMSNISIILSNQFSLTGITSPGEAITSVLYSTDFTPIRSGLKG